VQIVSNAIDHEGSYQISSKRIPRTANAKSIDEKWHSFRQDYKLQLKDPKQFLQLNQLIVLVFLSFFSPDFFKLRLDLLFKNFLRLILQILDREKSCLEKTVLIDKK
jgi:hypothetical protein